MPENHDNECIHDVRDIPLGYEPVADCREGEGEARRLAGRLRAHGQTVRIARDGDGVFTVWRGEFRDWPVR